MTTHGPLPANKLPKLKARRKTPLREFLEYHIEQAPAIEVRKDYAEILGEFIVWLIMLILGILTVDAKDKSTAKDNRKTHHSANDEPPSELFKSSSPLTFGPNNAMKKANRPNDYLSYGQQDPAASALSDDNQDLDVDKKASPSLS